MDPEEDQLSGKIPKTWSFLRYGMLKSGAHFD